MPKEKPEKVNMPTIQWRAKNWTLAFALLTELEKPENYKVFLGKKSSQENTSGESKIKVSQRIGEVILPDLYKLNPKVLGEHVRSELESLVTTYHKHVKRLRKTGEGVRQQGTVRDATEKEREAAAPAREEDEADEGTGELLIDGNGPNETTPEYAINIWGEIKKEFPLFPRMHALYASRPNAIPVAVTTGAGPCACKTRWMQYPSDTAVEESRLDPFILEVSRTQLASVSLPLATPTPVSQQRSFGSDVTNGTTMSTPRPTTSTPHQPASATAKLKSGLRVPTRSSSALDAVLDLACQNSERLKEEQKCKYTEAERRILLDEYAAGIWSRDEYKEKVKLLTDGMSPPAPSRLSPDWDDNLFGDDTE